MKNTLENKAKFFAQYWWQEVFIFGINQKRYRITKSRFNAETLKKPCWLELKPISQISDEDVVEISDFVYADRKVDYLRSKGYALPWNGIKVEEMIEWGWIKLEE